MADYPSCDHPGALVFSIPKQGDLHGYVAVDAADRIFAWGRNKRDLAREVGERLGPRNATSARIVPAMFDLNMDAAQPWLLAFSDVKDDLQDPTEDEEDAP